MLKINVAANEEPIYCCVFRGGSKPGDPCCEHEDWNLPAGRTRPHIRQTLQREQGGATESRTKDVRASAPPRQTLSLTERLFGRSSWRTASCRSGRRTNVVQTRLPVTDHIRRSRETFLRHENGTWSWRTLETNEHFIVYWNQPGFKRLQRSTEFKLLTSI